MPPCAVLRAAWRSKGSRTDLSDATVLQQEIAVEQRARRPGVRPARRAAPDASRAEREGYSSPGSARFGALVERDAMVFHAARRRHALDTEYEGLVFGRLDLTHRRRALRRPDGHPGRELAAAGGRLAGAGRGRVLPGHRRPSRWAWCAGG